jgi:hypothetical protein
MESQTIKVEILGFAGCPHFLPAVERARSALNKAGVEGVICQINVECGQAVGDLRFLGSPTIRINGLDVEFAARTASEFGFGCRTYLVNGKRQGLPPQEWIETAIREATRNELA